MNKSSIKYIKKWLLMNIYRANINMAKINFLYESQFPRRTMIDISDNAVGLHVRATKFMAYHLTMK